MGAALAAGANAPVAVAASPHPLVERRQPVHGSRAARRGGRGCAADFQESTVWSGLTNPTAIRFAPDGRVFVAEKSGLDQGLRRPRRPDPDGLRRPAARNVHNFWDRGLLGLALDPKFPPTGRTSTCSTPTTAADSAAPRRAGATPARPRRAPPPTAASVSGRLSRLSRRDVGRRAGAGRGLVPAVPEPLDRQRSPSAPTARCT